jgi:hypothetical protein
MAVVSGQTLAGVYYNPPFGRFRNRFAARGITDCSSGREHIVPYRLYTLDA